MIGTLRRRLVIYANIAAMVPKSFLAYSIWVWVELFTQVLGFTTATGTFTADTPNGVIVVPNTLTGLPIFTQAFAVDTGSANPIQFACSNGRSATVPAVGTAHVNQVSRLWNTVGGTSATQAFFSAATVGYSLATEISHL